MIKKKLHTLQYVQNKEEIERALKLLNDFDADHLEVIKEQLELMRIRNKNYMRRLKLRFYTQLIGCFLIITGFLYLIYKVWN